MTTALAPTVDWLRDRLPERPRVAMVLGSGLGALAERVEDPVRLPYGEIPGFAVPTVEGHAGALVAGRLAGVAVAALQGRFHLYEGHAAADIVVPVRALAELGADTLLVTCSAGALDPRFQAGDLMVLDDHVNLMNANPLVGPVVGSEERFPDMSRPYDAGLIRLAETVAARQGTGLQHGVYCAVSGPSYETVAETRMLQAMGGHAVGMSTVPEVLVARAQGLRVLGIALITNAAAGSGDGPVSHAEVVAAGAAAAERFAGLVLGVLEGIEHDAGR